MKKYNVMWQLFKKWSNKKNAEEHKPVYDIKYNSDIDKTGFEDYFGNGFSIKKDGLKIVDFRRGSHVDQKEIEKWREEVLNQLKEDTTLQFTSMKSGDSIVIGLRFNDGTIELIECNNGYREWRYELPNDIKLENKMNMKLTK